MKTEKIDISRYPTSTWLEYGRWEVGINWRRWLIGMEYYLGEWRVFLPGIVIVYRGWMPLPVAPK